MSNQCKEPKGMPMPRTEERYKAIMQRDNDTILAQHIEIGRLTHQLHNAKQQLARLRNPKL